jgi:hypothetical protein
LNKDGNSMGSSILWRDPKDADGGRAGVTYTAAPAGTSGSNLLIYSE